jgi:hypothetical protein
MNRICCYRDPDTKLPFQQISSDDVCVDNPPSTLYNTWQSESQTQGQWKSAENMDVAAYDFKTKKPTLGNPFVGFLCIFDCVSGLYS